MSPVGCVTLFANEVLVNQSPPPLVARWAFQPADRGRSECHPLAETKPHKKSMSTPFENFHFFCMCVKVEETVEKMRGSEEPPASSLPSSEHLRNDVDSQSGKLPSLSHTHAQISAVLISVVNAASTPASAALSRVTRVFESDLSEGFHTDG